MKGLWAIYKRECYSLFASPIFYVVCASFLVLAGYFFWSTVGYFHVVSFQVGRNPAYISQLNATEMVVRPFFVDLSIVLLLVCPFLTMRLMAEERRAGTVELLFTYPVGDKAIVLGKYLAALTLCCLMLLGTAPAMGLLFALTRLELMVVLSGYFGLMLLGGALLSLGIFTSALTENQIIAAVLAFGGGLMLWIIGWSEQLAGGTFGKVLGYLAITGHFENLAKGVLDSRDVAYYLILPLFFIFLTLRYMESRKWRG